VGWVEEGSLRGRGIKRFLNLKVVCDIIGKRRERVVKGEENGGIGNFGDRSSIGELVGGLNREGGRECEEKLLKRRVYKDWSENEVGVGGE
jgi:hypothetical protein